MCEFRKIRKIKLLSTGDIVHVKHLSVWHTDRHLIQEPAIYTICASGSISFYWDGQSGFYEHKDYEVMEYTNLYDHEH